MQQPRTNSFKPGGVPGRKLERVILQLDELEALRLADLDGLYHDDAALRMGISRPTFGRLIAVARSKVADALLHGKMLVFQGGPITMAQMRKFKCDQCGNDFEAPFGTGRPEACPACGAETFCRSDAGGERGHCRRRGAGGGRSGGQRGHVQRRGGATSDAAQSDSNSKEVQS